MIDRSAVMLKAKKPFLDWIRKTDKEGLYQDLSLEDLLEDRNVYLVAPEEMDELENWIEANHTTLLEVELEEWVTDEEQWPENLDLEMFNRFFDVEAHSVVLDTVGEAIEADDEFAE